MPPEIAAALGLELLAALAHAHGNGVVHRDVKPENVLLERRRPSQPERRRRTSAPSTSATGQRVLGEADRLRHRQAPRRPGRDLDRPGARKPRAHGARADRGRRGRRRSDVFGVGVLLYECMVGHLPFDGDNPAQVLRRVLDGVVSRGAARATDRRARAGAGSSTARSPTRRPIASPTRARCATRSPPSSSASTSRRRSAISRRGSTIPPAFDELHRTALVDAALRARGRRAQAGRRPRRGRRLQPRARAHAPDDPNLLRIVAGMNRAERRARALLRRVGRSVRRRARPLRARPRRRRRSCAGASSLRASAGPSVSVDPARPAAPTPASASRRSRPSSRGADRADADAPAARHPRASAPRRRVTLDLKPPMGVSVSIDGQPSRDVSTGDVLTLGSRGLTCSASRAPSALPSRSGSTRARGTPRSSSPFPSSRRRSSSTETSPGRTRSSSIPRSCSCRARTPSRCRSAYEPVTVKQIETGDSVSVRLEAAKTMHAAFPSAPCRTERPSSAGSLGKRLQAPLGSLDRVPRASLGRAVPSRSSTPRVRGPAVVALAPRRVPRCRRRAVARGGRGSATSRRRTTPTWRTSTTTPRRACARSSIPRTGDVEGRRQHRRRAHVPRRVAPRARQEGRRRGGVRAASARQAGLPARLAPGHAAGHRRAHRRALAHARRARGHPWPRGSGRRRRRRPRLEAERQKAALRLAMLEKLASEETRGPASTRAGSPSCPSAWGSSRTGRRRSAGRSWRASRSSSSGSAISQVVTIYNVNQMNDAIQSGSSTATGYHARAKDAFVATDLFTAGFALVAHRGDHPRARRRSCPSTSRSARARCRRSRSRRPAAAHRARRRR